MKDEIAIIEKLGQDMGYSHVSPESLKAIGERAKYGLLSTNEYQAYRVVLAGVYALFAPIHRTPQ